MRKCISTELLQFVAASQSLTQFKKKDLPAVEDQKSDSDSDCESSSSYTTTSNEDGEFEEEDDGSVDETGVKMMMKEVNFRKYPNSLSFKDRLYNDNLVVETLYEKPKTENPKEMNTNESSKKVKDIHFFSSENSDYIKNNDSKKSSTYSKCFSFNSSAASLPSKLTPVSYDTPSIHHPSSHTPVTFSSLNETEDSVFERTKQELKLRTETNILNEKTFNNGELDPSLLHPFDSKEQSIFKSDFLKCSDSWNHEVLLKSDDCSGPFKKENIATNYTKRQKVFSFEPSFQFSNYNPQSQTMFFSSDKKTSLSNQFSGLDTKFDKNFDNVLKNGDKNYEKKMKNVFFNKVYAIESPHFFGIKNRSKSREGDFVDKSFSHFDVPFVSIDSKNKQKIFSHTKKSSEIFVQPQKKNLKTRSTKKRKLSSKSRFESTTSPKKSFCSKEQTFQQLPTFNKLVKDMAPPQSLDGFFTDHEGYNSESTTLDPFLSKTPICEDTIQDVQIFEKHKNSEKKINKSLQTLPVEMIPTKICLNRSQNTENVEVNSVSSMKKNVMEGIKEKFYVYNKEVFKKGYKPSKSEYEMVLKKVMEETERKLDIKHSLLESGPHHEDLNDESIMSNIGEINDDLKDIEKAKSKKIPLAKKFTDPNRGLVPKAMPPGMLPNGLPAGSQKVVHNYLETGGLSATSSVASIDHPNKDNDIKEVMDLENYISPVLMEKHKIRNGIEKSIMKNNCLSACCHNTPSGLFTISPLQNSSLFQNFISRNIYFPQNKILRNSSLPQNSKTMSSLPVYKDSSDDDGDIQLHHPPKPFFKSPLSNQDTKTSSMKNPVSNFHTNQQAEELKASLQRELFSLQQYNPFLNSSHFDEKYFDARQLEKVNDKIIDQTESINRLNMVKENNIEKEKNKENKNLDFKGLDEIIIDDQTQLKKERLQILRELVELKKLKEIKELSDLKELINMKEAQNNKLMQDVNTKKHKPKNETTSPAEASLDLPAHKQKKPRKKDDSNSSRSLTTDSDNSACRSKDIFKALKGVLEITKHFKKEKKQTKRRKKCNDVSSIESFATSFSPKRVDSPTTRTSQNKDLTVQENTKKDEATVDVLSESDNKETKKVLEKLMELTKKINSFELTKKEANSVVESDSLMSTPIFSKAVDNKNSHLLNKSNISPLDTSYIHPPFSQYSPQVTTFNNNLPIDFSIHSFRQCNNSCDEVSKNVFPFGLSHDIIYEPLNLSTDETTTSQQNAQIQLKEFSFPCTTRYEKELIEQTKVANLNKARISVDSHQLSSAVNEKSFKFEYTIEADSYPKLDYATPNIQSECYASLSLSDMAIAEQTSNDPHEINKNDMIINRCCSNKSDALNENSEKISEMEQKGNFIKVVDCSRYVNDAVKMNDSAKTLVMLESLSLSGLEGHPNRVVSSSFLSKKNGDTLERIENNKEEKYESKTILKKDSKKSIDSKKHEFSLKNEKIDNKDENVYREKNAKVDGEKDEIDKEIKKVKSATNQEVERHVSETHNITQEWVFPEPSKQRTQSSSCKEIFQKQQSISSSYKNSFKTQHSSTITTETFNKEKSVKSNDQDLEKSSKKSAQCSSSSISQTSKQSTVLSGLSNKEHFSNVGNYKEASKSKTSHSTIRETIGNYLKKLPKPRLKVSKTLLSKKGKSFFPKLKVNSGENEITDYTKKEYTTSTEDKVKKFYDDFLEIDTLKPTLSHSQEFGAILEHKTELNNHIDNIDYNNDKVVVEGNSRADYDWVGSLKRNDSVLQEKSVVKSGKDICDFNEFISMKKKILLNLQKFKRERGNFCEEGLNEKPTKTGHMHKFLEDNFIKNVVRKYDSDIINFPLNSHSATFQNQTFLHRGFKFDKPSIKFDARFDGFYDKVSCSSPPSNSAFEGSTYSDKHDKSLQMAMNQVMKDDTHFKDYLSYLTNDLTESSPNTIKKSIFKTLHSPKNNAGLQSIQFDYFDPTDGVSKQQELFKNIETDQHSERTQRPHTVEPTKHIVELKKHTKLYGEKRTQTSKNSLPPLCSLEIQTSQKLLDVYTQKHMAESKTDLLSHVTTLKEDEKDGKASSVEPEKKEVVQQRDAISESMLEQTYFSLESFMNYNHFGAQLPEAIEENEKEPLCNEIKVTKMEKQKIAEVSKTSDCLFDDQNLSGFMKLCLDSKKNHREVPNFLDERSSSQSSSLGDWEFKPPYVTSSLCSAIKCVSRQEKCRNAKNIRNLCPSYIPKFSRTTNSNINNHNNLSMDCEDLCNKAQNSGSDDEEQGFLTICPVPMQSFPFHPPKMARKDILHIINRHLHWKFWQHIFKNSSALGKDINSYVNLVDPWNGQSMLTEAVMVHEWVTVDNLMWLGAILDLEDQKGRSSFSMATSLNDHQSIKLHFKHGLILDDLRFLKVAKFYLKKKDELYEYLKLLFNCGWIVQERYKNEVVATLKELKSATKTPVSQMLRHLKTPLSLQLLCRSSMRKILRKVTNHRSICDVVHHLPLPPSLKSFLLSTSLHLIK